MTVSHAMKGSMIQVNRDMQKLGPGKELFVPKTIKRCVGFSKTQRSLPDFAHMALNL